MAGGYRHSLTIPTGTRFGRLLTLSEADRAPPTKAIPHGARQFRVQCDCGSEPLVVRLSNLRKGTTQSCGCLQIDRARQKNTTHGLSTRPVKVGRGSIVKAIEYRCWVMMHQRCYNPNTTGYKNWGGRGIRVCPEWSGPDGFLQFCQDIGPRPGLDYSIERRDTNGNYTPDNCRWATDTEQNRNRRDSVMLSYAGETLHVNEWAGRYSLTSQTLIRRLRAGWSVEDALFTPLRR